jgi:catechol 2,3-dioxygenase-like lactoylglutathione lyase family enzyme
MLDHVTLNVSDYEASRRFYEQALAPLGFEVVFADDEWRGCGFGTGGKPWFIVAEREPRPSGAHIAFAAADRATVDSFHAARSFSTRTAATSRPSATGRSNHAGNAYASASGSCERQKRPS